VRSATRPKAAKCSPVAMPGRTIRCVSVPQQIAGCGLPGKGLGHLARKPDLCGIFSHLEMNDFSAVMAKHDQGIENPKRRGCHNEHVDRRDIGQVVVQEATPSRGGDFRSPRQVSPDGGLADLDAELEQVAVDAGRAPQSGVARLIWRIRSRISVLVLSRPGRRDRHRQ